jgi:RNA polymerase sigma-70 factor (ECF subfamily)
MNLENQDNILIKQYLKGNKKSLEVLIKKHLKTVYSFCYKNVGSPYDAEDITQEVFLKVWKNIKKFDTSKDFKPWLFQIARNACIDFLRKKKTIPFSRFENEKGQNFMVEKLEGKSFDLINILNNKKTIAIAMQGLSGKEQKIVDLKHNAGFTFKEISEILKESINTVKSRYRRTIIYLRKNIEKS